MTNKILFATTGLMCAIVVHFSSSGRFLLAGIGLAVAVWAIHSINMTTNSKRSHCPFPPVDRLKATFRYLSTLDLGDAELTGTYIYEELDIDARSELSDHVLSHLIEDGSLTSSLADRIRRFRANVISKIDERISAEAIPSDEEWCKLLVESQQIHHQLTQVAG